MLRYAYGWIEGHTTEALQVRAAIIRATSIDDAGDQQAYNALTRELRAINAELRDRGVDAQRSPFSPSRGFPMFLIYAAGPDVDNPHLSHIWREKTDEHADEIARLLQSFDPHAPVMLYDTETGATTLYVSHDVAAEIVRLPA